MNKPCVGIDGIARKITGGYIGVNGVARKIKKAYIGVDGVARLCWKGHSLAYDSWETISEISRSGNAAEFYAIGDEKEVELTTGETITLQIIGFNHDTLSDGSGSAGITFGMKNLLATKYGMNDAGTNVGGWTSSVMRTRLQPGGEIYETLPDEVKAAIRPVDKLTSAGNFSQTLETTSDYSFLLSEVEVFDTSTHSFAGEGKLYDYYANTAADKIKYLPDGTATNWWERSPVSSSDNTFCCVTRNGVSNLLMSATGSIGVSFAFCV